MFNVKILSKEDIMQVIEMKPVIKCVEEVYTLKSQGDTVVWPTTFYEFDPGHADAFPGPEENPRCRYA